MGLFSWIRDAQGAFNFFLETALPCRFCPPSRSPFRDDCVIYPPTQPRGGEGDGYKREGAPGSEASSQRRRPAPRVSQGRQRRSGAEGTMAEDLQLETWDLKWEENNQDHKTSEMGSHRLVVRRGQPFRITLHFAGRAYQEGVDRLTFIAETGPCPIETSGTRAPFPLSCSLEGPSWSSAVEQQEGLSLSVAIASPPDARIGRYPPGAGCLHPVSGLQLPPGRIRPALQPLVSRGFHLHGEQRGPG
ncbi:protein-glutamine gamma-glutamyltransferase 2-like [Crotalus adamanteus]|uniref:Protein-glutamine gamma-glutamyltransferase 2-like n=1 Tax=Crotalus adamanteus TaxID=8729 RepID=A0AAW1BU12_CROAD